MDSQPTSNPLIVPRLGFDHQNTGEYCTGNGPAETAAEHGQQGCRVYFLSDRFGGLERGGVNGYLPIRICSPISPFFLYSGRHSCAKRVKAVTSSGRL